MILYESPDKGTTIFKVVDGKRTEITIEQLKQEILKRHGVKVV